MNYFWHYKVKWTYKDDELEEEDGLTLGDSYVDAMQSLVECYGNDLEAVLYLSPIGDGGPCLPFEDMIDVLSESLKKEGVS